MRKIMVAAAVLAVAGSTACSKKVDECNAMIKVMNDSSGALKPPEKGEDDAAGIKKLRGMADTADKAAADVGKLTLTTPELKGFADEYAKMMKEVAAATRESADAVEKKDAEKILPSADKMSKAIDAESPLVDKINKFCQGG